MHAKTEGRRGPRACVAKPRRQLAGGIRHGLRGCAATLLSIVVSSPAAAAGGTATDQAVNLTYPVTHWSAAPVANLVGVNASGDPLYQSGWWYRVSGDTREHPLPPPDSEDYSGGRILAGWSNVDGKGFALTELTFVVDGEGPSGGFWSTVGVHNDSASPLEVTLFHYLDGDLAGSADGDRGARLTPLFLEITEGASRLSYRAAGASHYQISAHPELRDLLNDTALTTLSDTNWPFGPGDATAAFQFGPVTILPGGGSALGWVSAFFDPPRRHVKGDSNGLGLAMLDFQSPGSGTWSFAWMRRVAASNTGGGFGSCPTASSAFAGIDDFDGDYRDEPAFRDTVTGVAYVGPAALAGAPTLALNWKLSATGDFDADGKADLLWRNTTSQKLVVWTMNGSTKVGNIVPSPDQAVDANWEVAAAADFDGDGNRDLLWYNQTSGKIVVWFMNASVQRITGQFTNPSSVGNNNWKVLAVGDYGRGPGGVYDTQDVVWQNDTSKKTVVWFMDLAGNRTSGTFTEPDTIVSGANLVGPR